MQIKGFQKTTFIDYPNKVAALVFTGGCNFRCPYCHNGGLVLKPTTYPTILPESVLKHLEKRRGVIEGLVITGGEPTLVPGLADFIRQVKAMDVAVKLDTNGTNPETVEGLIQDGLLDYIAMDIKHDFSKYDLVVGPDRADIQKLKKSVNVIISSGIEHEFRTTMIRGIHGAQDVQAMTRQIAGAQQYILQQYVKSDGELMSNTFKSYTLEELQGFVDGLDDTAGIGTIRVRGKY